MRHEDFISALSTFGLSEKQKRKSVEYLKVLKEWNKTVPLVSRRVSMGELREHFVDSLKALGLIREVSSEGLTILDIGSGGGFPAIALAISFPDNKFFLLEPSIKKFTFLTVLKRKIDINNIFPLRGRVEELNPEIKYDFITVKALRLGKENVAKLVEMLNSKGKIIVWHGTDLPLEGWEKKLFLCRRIEGEKGCISLLKKIGVE